MSEHDTSQSSTPPPSWFAALMESLNSCCALLDGSGRILAVNFTWSRFPGENPFILNMGVGSDYRELCIKLIGSPDGHASIVALGLNEVLKGKILKLALDYPCGVPGCTRWFGVSAIRMPWPEPLVVIHHHDITERVEARRRLHRVEHLFRATTENALDLIAILDDHGHMTYTSPSYAKLMGYVQRDWMDGTYPQYVHEEDRGVFQAAISEGFARGLSPLFEYRFAHHDGTWRFLEGRVAVVENTRGDIDSVLLVSRDVTTRKESENQRVEMEVQLRHAQKMEAIGQLAAGIAHEINTPVQYINDNLRFLDEAFQDLGEVFSKEGAFLQRAFVDSLLSSEAKTLAEWVESKDTSYLLEEVPKALQQSKEGVRRVATIIQAMKVFSHPGTEGRSSINLNQAIENTVLVARNEWKYIAEVDLDLDPHLPAVECYPGEINQVVLNLVVNAAHAIEEAVGNSGQKGTILVQTRAMEDSVEIRVEDSGTGIPEEVQDKIFLPFFTTKSVGRGTGQGLSIVHSVVSKHGGHVTFETQLGEGTCFIVTLPLRAPADSQPHAR